MVERFQFPESSWIIEVESHSEDLLQRSSRLWYCNNKGLQTAKPLLGRDQSWATKLWEWGLTCATSIKCQVQSVICILCCCYYMQTRIAEWAGKPLCGTNSLIVCVWMSRSLINHPIHSKSIALLIVLLRTPRNGKLWHWCVLNSSYRIYSFFWTWHFFTWI